MDIRIRRLRPEAPLPRYATEGAAGMDLCAFFDPGFQWIVFPGEWLAVPTGIAIEIPLGHEGQIRPRSGLAQKHGITVLNSLGTIDSDFRGELRVVLYNAGGASFEVQSGMRIAQLVIAPVTRVSWIVAEGLEDTERGSGGFGSTGT